MKDNNDDFGLNLLPESEDRFDGRDLNDMLDDNIVKTLLPFLIHPKPFGMLWPRAKMIYFLKARGWKVKERYNDMTEESYTVAYKKGETKLPSEDNILSSFENEMQDTILDILLKLSK